MQSRSNAIASLEPHPFDAAAPRARPGQGSSPIPTDGSPFELAACKALEIAGLAIVIADTGGRVQQFNGVAKCRLRSGPLKLIGGRLAGANELDTRRLRDAIRWTEEAEAGATRSVPLSASPHRAAEQVIVTPLRTAPGKAPGAPLVLIILANDVVPAQPPAAEVHLTEAEFRLLKGLTAGERLATYASRSGVKLSTVKTHLQSLFGKLGERRQTDLVRRAMSDPALRRRIANGRYDD